MSKFRLSGSSLVNTSRGGSGTSQMGGQSQFQLGGNHNSSWRGWGPQYAAELIYWCILQRN